ncbi:MAG: hypothetical protein NC548_30250 [Lachnospiraceae bacterium]|nr:hypothetical protein [Lachnospiraceae bacterium]
MPQKNFKKVIKEDYEEVFSNEEMPVMIDYLKNNLDAKNIGILLDHNVDNRMIMEQMGHTDISCTENHYHRNRRSIDAKSQILSNIPELQAK